MGVDEDFTARTGGYRGELLAHCYRMLGSAEEAEDLVQETYLRAWRGWGAFQGRAAVRTWLYRIATNACLTALRRRARRPLPSGLGGPAADPAAPMSATAEVPWLQPFPDALLAAADADPAAVAQARAGVRLALVAALQHLSARQRAVLLLRDVLQRPAAEVAALLGTTTTAVNSGLRRARALLAASHPVADELAEPPEPARRALLDRFAAAIEAADVRAFAALLRDDVTLEMPPFAAWFAGRAAVVRCAELHLLTGPGDLRLDPTRANGREGFLVYRHNRPHAVLLPVPKAGGIVEIISFVGEFRPERWSVPAWSSTTRQS
ncbi:RNA polymerase subunit sigma-70 [Dactylosporangium sp. McL0621]|uniref:RNA polymerase subunit sigma-70 n=1 Tax=Dactylosporangium sp. McL0621 TaxID=3415678 RepID=UPI003CEEEF30